MKLVVIPVFLFCVALFSPRASASVASFVTTDQDITFTGLGGNARCRDEALAVGGGAECEPRARRREHP